jgi:hypothetical protein
LDIFTEFIHNANAKKILKNNFSSNEAIFFFGRGDFGGGNKQNVILGLSAFYLVNVQKYGLVFNKQ